MWLVSKNYILYYDVFMFYRYFYNYEILIIINYYKLLILCSLFIRFNIIVLQVRRLIHLQINNNKMWIC